MESSQRKQGFCQEIQSWKNHRFQQESWLLTGYRHRECAQNEDRKNEPEPLKNQTGNFSSTLYDATYSSVPSIGVFPHSLLIAIGSFPFTIMEIVMCNSHTPPALPSSTKKGRRNMKRRLIEYQSSPGSQNLVRRRLLSCTPTLWRSLRLRCSVVGGLAYVL